MVGYKDSLVSEGKQNQLINHPRDAKAIAHLSAYRSACRQALSSGSLGRIFIDVISHLIALLLVLAKTRNVLENLETVPKQRRVAMSCREKGNFPGVE